jgi:acyl-coenzyme A synthetase/AMP-(fatty) acid ligase
MTYGEFRAAVDALASHLQGMGIGKADKIAIMLSQLFGIPHLYFAASASAP